MIFTLRGIHWRRFSARSESSDAAAGSAGAGSGWCGSPAAPRVPPARPAPSRFHACTSVARLTAFSRSQSCQAVSPWPTRSSHTWRSTTHGKRRRRGMPLGHHRHRGCGHHPAVGPQRGTDPRPLGPAHDRALRRDRLLHHAAVHARHPLHEAALHLTHGGAVLLVFLLGAHRLRRPRLPVRLAAGHGATHFGHQLPTLVDEAKKGKGPLGKLVFRLHLQKYLSESSSKFDLADHQGTQARHRPLGRRRRRLDHRRPGHHRRADVLHHARGTADVARLPPLVPASRRRDRLSRVVDETIRSVTGYMLGNFLTSVIAGLVVFVSADHPRRPVRRAPGHLRGPGRPVAARRRAAGRCAGR